MGGIKLSNATIRPFNSVIKPCNSVIWLGVKGCCNGSNVLLNCSPWLNNIFDSILSNAISSLSNLF